MKKTIFLCSLFFVLSAFGGGSLSSVFAQAQENHPDDFRFTETAAAVTITDYREMGGSVVIPQRINNKPVTAIGNSAFSNKRLTGVTIPGTVTSIGVSAFYNNQLTSVTLPPSVTTIGNSAFSGNQLISITIGANVTLGTDITGDASFNTAYTSSGRRAGTYTRPNASSSVWGAAPSANPADDYAFTETASGITITGYTGPTGISIVIPERFNNKPVTTIGNFAFMGKQLTGVTIPGAVTSIGARAFENNRLTSVIIPPSVTSIDNFAFMSNSLSRITIGADVTLGNEVMGDQGFATAYTRENRLAGVYARSGTSWSGVDLARSTDPAVNLTVTETATAVTITRYNGPGGNVVIPERFNNKPVTAIGDNAYREKGLTGITIPNTVTSIGNGAFSFNQLTSVTIPPSVSSIGSQAFTRNQLTSVTISPGVTAIGDMMFYANSLTSVTFPDTVTSIGSQAFAANQLTSVTLPPRLSALGNGAFSNNRLTSVAIPNSVTAIGENAFALNQLTSVTIGSGVTVIGSRAFTQNQLTSVAIPNGVTAIGESAFFRNQLTSLAIPASVIAIGNDAFFANQLTSLTLSNGLRSIGNGAFQENRLTSVTIPASVTSIGGLAFYKNQLASVTLPPALTGFSERAFADNQLTSVTIPDTVTTIGPGAFMNNRLASVTIPNGVKTIMGGAFANNQLASVTIPQSVTSIEADDRHGGAFANNRLTSLAIPATVTNINSGVFRGNPLTSITLPANSAHQLHNFIDNGMGLTAAYNDNSWRAGTYTRASAAAAAWSYAGAGAPAAPTPSPAMIGRADPDAANWNISLLDTAANVDYLSAIEKDVILEMNKVRADPRKYAELYIRPRLQYYNGRNYTAPGQQQFLITQEGAAAVNECIAVLTRAAAVGVLTPERGLYLAARDHVTDQSRTGQTGHDGSTWQIRMNRYGGFSGASANGENIAYGPDTAREIVIALLVDDGVPDRGHRVNIMRKEFTQTGAAYGTHPQIRVSCTITYAHGYRSR
jgi:uncharacterized protein YkwD